MEKLFVLYDGRAKTLPADDASVYVTGCSEAEAKKDGMDSAWQDGIWYEYDVNENDELVNQKVRWDLPPNGKE